MRCPFRAMRRTLHFWNHIIASNNAHSFACVLLFPKSTKYLLGSPDLRYRNITLRQILILRLVRQKPRLKWWFLSNCQKDTLAIIYNDGFNNVLINSGVDQVRKLVKADKMAFIVLGFITRYPFRAMRRMLLFWPTDCRKRQSPVLCLHTPFPREYTVSRGVPDFSLAMTGHPGVSRTARRLHCMNFGKC